jgi:DNA-binding response OmpR family regulator
LVVDDSPETLQIVTYTLQRGNCEVWSAESGEAALKQIKSAGLPDLAIVDINMPPGMDGFELCRRIFQFSDLPVLMLTAVDEAETVVHAIQQYAEDYIIKPFNPAELLARVRRILRRVGTFPYVATSPVKVDDLLSIDFPRRKVIISGQASSLTPTETRLLYILMRGRGETVTTDFLLRRMWPREVAYEDRLHVYIHRLRKKLQVAGDEEYQYVVSERGVGYRFRSRDGVS